MLRVLFETFPAYVTDDIYNHLTEYKGTLLYSPTGTKTDETEIGSISCYYVDVRGAGQAGYSPSQVYDLYSDTFDIYTHLYKNDRSINKEAFLPKQFKRNSNVLIVSSLKVDKTFKGKRFGLALLRRTLQQLGMGADITCLFAHPIVDMADIHKDHRHAQAALIEYYTTFGFDEVTRGSGVMAYDMTQGLPSMEDLGVIEH